MEETLKNILIQYAEFVETRLYKAKNGDAEIKAAELMDEVRTVNVLCVTYDRMRHKAQKTEGWESENGE